MEKYNAKSKNGVFVLILAIFAIVLSFAFSGAWYTDSTQKGINTGGLQMGSVSLSKDEVTLTSKSKTLANVGLLPTMTIDIAEIQYTGNVNAYYRIEVTSSNEKNSEGQDFSEDELSELKTIFSDATIYNAVEPNSTISAHTITIPSSLGNAYQGASANLKVTITVLQQPNLNNGMTSEAARQAFAQANV